MTALVNPNQTGKHVAQTVVVVVIYNYEINEIKMSTFL